MSAPSPSAAAKPGILSYAERAKRAGTAASASTVVSQPPRARPAVSNGNGRVPRESASPASTSASNVAQSSTTQTHATSSTSETTQTPTQSGDENQQQQQQKAAPIPPKSPSKPPATNVWAARKEQMAQRVTAQHTQSSSNATLSPQVTENQVASSSTKREPAMKEASSRPLSNGIANASSYDDQSSSVSAKTDDPFVVRIPPHHRSQSSSITTRTPPSLDDIQSWPEMGKGGLSVSTSASESLIAGSTGSDVDKKEASMSIHKKGEKTKWVPVPASELQFTTPDPHSPSHSRTHSQHRRNKQTQSRSRQQSQTRSISGKPQGVTNSVVSIAGNHVPGRFTGSHGSTASGEVSNSHSRAESTSQSRATSVHSSPRIPPRGRRLPDEQSPGVYSSLSQIATSVHTAFASGPSVNARKLPITVLPNGDITEEEVSDITAATSVDPAASDFKQPLSLVEPSPTALRSQNPLVPHSQSHSPYTSHSPVYYAPPLPMAPYVYNGMYGLPPPPLPPAQYDHQQYPPHQLQSPTGSAHGHQPPHAYQSYPPYPIHPGQPHYPYMYHPMPYSYYPPQAPGQPHERPLDNNALPMQVQNQEGKFEGASNDDIALVAEDVGKLIIQSPTLPPPSLLTHPPPPDESAALAGYREVSAISISPLLNAHRPMASIDAIASSPITPPKQMESSLGGKKEEMVFGSVGRPGGIKSPSPAPGLPAGQGSLSTSSPGLGLNEKLEQQHNRSNTTFAVGIDGQDAERIKSRIKRSRGDTGSSCYQLADSDKPHDSEATLADVQTDSLVDQPTSSDAATAPKYHFGTSSDSEDVPRSDGVLHVAQGGENQQEQEQILQPQPHQPPILHYPPHYPHYTGYHVLPPPGVPVNMQMNLQSLPSPSPHAANQPLPQHIPSLHPFPVNPGFVSPLALSSPGPNSGPPSAVPGDEFLEVRDFGYGFGPMSGNGYPHDRAREERFERERERDREREHRDMYREPREYFGGGGRGRRGGGPSFDRGGYAGRRGRVGPGYRGYNRGFARGGHGGNRQQPSLNVSTNPLPTQQPGVRTPVAQMQPPAMVDAPGEFYPPPPSSQGSSPYPTSPYTMFIPPPQLPLTQPTRPPPPVQPPITKLSFPLDPTSYRILGQLEYYFSSDNLPQDYFLRKNMDSRGWIDVEVIAGFNRIRSLTDDKQTVKNVLGISSILEVKNDRVRLNNRQWQKYILPNAAASIFEDEDEEEEDEDDVVFVLGGEANKETTITRVAAERLFDVFESPKVA